MNIDIVAHRGASHDAPENTLAAVSLAWEQGADAVEIDVHLTRDNHLVVMHDADTHRTTGISGAISHSTLKELKKLDAGTWKGGQFTGEPIPTLDEVLCLLPPGKRLLIELKGGGPSILGPLHSALKPQLIDHTQIHLISFDPILLAQAKAEYPHIKMLWLRGTPPETDVAARWANLEGIITTCHAAKLDGISMTYRWPIDERLIQRVRDAGLLLYAWTVNSPDIARTLADIGIHGITTDKPGEIRSALQFCSNTH